MAHEEKYTCDCMCGFEISDFSDTDKNNTFHISHPIFKLYYDGKKLYTTVHANADLCSTCKKNYEYTLDIAIKQFNSIIDTYFPNNSTARFLKDV